MSNLETPTRARSELLSVTCIDTIVRVLTVPTERARLLRRGTIYLGKWLLAGVALTIPLAAGQISNAGLHPAWERFGGWWVVAPFLICLIPSLFGSIRVISEVAVLLLLFTMVTLARLIGYWGTRVVKIVFVVGVAALCAWTIWAIGYSVAGPPPVARIEHVPPTPSAPTATSPELPKWLWAGAATLGLGALLMLRNVGEAVLAEWAKRKLGQPKVKSQTIPIYDQNGRVVRNVARDATETG